MTSRSVFIMTHDGTRVFWRSNFASRFFLDFDFLPIVSVFPPLWLNGCSFCSLLSSQPSRKIFRNEWDGTLTSHRFKLGAGVRSPPTYLLPNKS